MAEGTLYISLEILLETGLNVAFSLAEIATSDGALAGAPVRAPDVDVKAEVTRRETVCLRFHRVGKERSNFVENAQIRRRVRARRATDRRLIHENDLFKLFVTLQTVVRQDWKLRAFSLRLGNSEFLTQRRVKRPRNKGRFSRAAHARDDAKRM